VREDEFYAEIDRAFGHRTHGRFEPNTDVYIDEAGARLLVHVELAGTDSDELKIAVDERYLYIMGSRSDRAENRAATSILQKEILYGEFFKKIRLPLPVDDAGARATYRDGILSISLPLAPHDRFPTMRTEIRMTVKRTLA
jgi:HSP20 family protein